MNLMCHADIRLTTAIYQHLDLVDTAGAANRLRWSVPERWPVRPEHTDQRMLFFRKAS
jgi:hypothetical protein